MGLRLRWGLRGVIDAPHLAGRLRLAGSLVSLLHCVSNPTMVLLKTYPLSSPQWYHHVRRDD